MSITVGSPPAADDSRPTAGATFRAGDVDHASAATASDRDDGPLPGGSLSWKVVFHHDSHIHPVLDGVTGASGTLTVPATGHSFNGSTSYEIVLTATDGDGIQTTASVTIQPEKAPVCAEHLARRPGPAARRDQPHERRSRRTRWSASATAVDAPTPQFVGTTRYAFASWSDGGAKAHTRHGRPPAA